MKKKLKSGTYVCTLQECFRNYIYALEFEIIVVPCHSPTTPFDLQIAHTDGSGVGWKLRIKTKNILALVVTPPSLMSDLVCLVMFRFKKEIQNE